MDINEMRRRYREKKEQEKICNTSEPNSQVSNHDNANVKYGESSYVSLSDDLSYEYERGSNLVSFSCSRLDNESDERTGMLSMICWISEKPQKDGDWQNDNYALADSVDLGVLEKGSGFQDINITFEISDNLLKAINKMNEETEEWHFVFTINEQHEDGNNYIIHTVNGPDEQECISLSISDESLTILKDSDDNFSAYIEDEEFTGTLFSSDERFSIDFKDSVVSSLAGYHKNNEVAFIIYLDSSDNDCRYYDENGNEIEKKVFDRKYGSEFKKIINTGFEELESRAAYKNKVVNKQNYISSNDEQSSIFPIVKAIVVDKLSVEPYEVVESASFANDLGADSLDTVELIMELEKEFGINVPDDVAEKIVTVGDAVAFIEKVRK